MEAERNGMRRKISTLFSRKSGRGRDLGQCVAALVIALTLTVTGAAGYAASIFEPQTLLVEPAAVYDEENDLYAAQEQTAEEPAAEAEDQVSESQQAASEASEPVTETAPEAAEEPAEPAEQSQEPAAEEPAAAPQDSEPVTDTNAAPAEEAEAAAEPVEPDVPAAEPVNQPALEEENGLTEMEVPVIYATNGEDVWQEMDSALAAEDPLQARYEATTITPDSNGRITLTPEEFNLMLENQSIDWDKENCFTWFFNWLFNWLFPEKETPVYSGWRTEGGKTYYYSPTTHEKVTGLQTIDDKIYYFDAKGVRQDNVTFGIDVSRYQQKVDWKKVKAAGASFVIIRIGYRGYETGALVLDSMFENHFAGAKAAGLKVGVYIFSQAINEDEAREEAFACAYVLNGRKLDYPVYFDSEYSTSSHTGRADNLSKAQRTACAVAFCEELKKYGYEPGVYASTSWFQNHLDLSALKGYRIWNAHYGISAPTMDCDMWQGSCTGKLTGVSSSGLDLNISYMG